MSSVSRISEARVREVQTQLSEQQLQRRIELHTSDSLEVVRSVRTDGEAPYLEAASEFAHYADDDPYVEAPLARDGPTLPATGQHLWYHILPHGLPPLTHAHRAAHARTATRTTPTTA